MVYDDLETSEKRKYPRCPRPYTIQFRVLSENQRPGFWDIVLSQDIGAGGVLFYYPRAIKPETRLSFKINLGIGEKPVLCSGRVLRCRTANPSLRIFHVAAQFVEISPADFYRLNYEAEKNVL